MKWLVVPVAIILFAFFGVLVFLPCHLKLMNQPLHVRNWIWKGGPEKYETAGIVVGIICLVAMYGLVIWVITGFERYGKSLLNTRDLKHRPGLRFLRFLGGILLVAIFVFFPLCL